MKFTLSKLEKSTSKTFSYTTTLFIKIQLKRLGSYFPYEHLETQISPFKKFIAKNKTKIQKKQRHSYVFF